ncbi:DUF885 family protein [Sphingomonas abietis]|uniref:DUF885 family protein n=1 Tax=Sphingomonas abietis TaxID=3012344 RepID=A0ABY7NTG1_9SPHN|nr:DUF885 family protein [Sphingomonas abietis]WBO23731.1 DUF885 family protein [Sphingomonas abietis]
MSRWAATSAIAAALFLTPAGMAAEPAANAPDIARQMPQIVTNYTADYKSLAATYRISFAPITTARFDTFYRDQLATLNKVDFDGLRSQEDRVDYLLLKNYITGQQHQLALLQHHAEEMAPLLPFAGTIETFIDQKRRMVRPDGEQDAAALTAITKSIAAAKLQFDPSRPGAKKTTAVIANRAMLASIELQNELHAWYGQYDGYDPLFTWWAEAPYKDANAAITDYIGFLKNKLVGIAPDDKTTIIGDPVGREALIADLHDNMISYTPEELIAIAQTEYDWCMREMLKASREMGYGDDWHAAVEKAKQMHVAPGEQPDVIRNLVLEGSNFVEQHDLVTVPPLADETWRMIMMTPERQLVNPFFTGGNELSVSYPTDSMSFDQREMSMRGNATPLSHATAFHEMIPGHFLQFYMGARYNPYRQQFATPFWHEGNALWWEMLLWDMGFDKTPAEKVGALMWRMHRSARIIFTMNFHLGKWTPQECAQYLIDNVGFEPDNATAEVRRSFNGSVGPLYQSAYLLGGLQFRALHHELVDSGKMTNRDFHDAILHENSMPIEFLRADLENQSLSKDFSTRWKFYGDHPTHR